MFFFGDRPIDICIDGVFLVGIVPLTYVLMGFSGIVPLTSVLSEELFANGQ